MKMFANVGERGFPHAATVHLFVQWFYCVTSGSNMTRDVHRCVTVGYQQIENSNIANQIHGFTIDYGKFILIIISKFSAPTIAFLAF